MQYHTLGRRRLSKSGAGLDGKDGPSAFASGRRLRRSWPLAGLGGLVGTQMTRPWWESGKLVP
jgi:hypothetical protein